MELFEDRGVVIREKTLLSVDSANGKNREVLITHAHSDHGRTNRSNNYYMTEATASLLKKNKSKKTKIKEFNYEKKFNLNEFTVSFHNAGHMLGSSQIKVESDADVVITSDFNLQKDLLFEPAEILPSDILVIETTFGLPEFSFPERELVYEEMAGWVKKSLGENRFVLLGGYSTGKAQELTAFVNEYLGEAPLVYKPAYENNKIYEEHNIRLGDYRALNDLKEGNILIAPPYLLQPELMEAMEYTLRKKVVAAVATGWKSHYRHFRQFSLSGHADFNQLMDYIKQSEPKLVLTHHGFASEFANAVQRRLKIPAKPLDEKGQKTLVEFGF